MRKNLSHFIIPLFTLMVPAACSGPSANQSVTNSISTTKNLSPTKTNVDTADIAEIRTLIRNMLKWTDGKINVDLLPTTIKDSICTGFDMAKVNEAAQKMKATGFFADEFIDNYKHIMQTLDKKIKNKVYGNWNGEEIPPFAFDSDANPWCSCQDNMSWDNVDVEVVKLDTDKGELRWNWGKLDPGTDPSWKESATPFRVVKVNAQWKISYLWGFDYKESTK